MGWFDPQRRFELLVCCHRVSSISAREFREPRPCGGALDCSAGNAGPEALPVPMSWAFDSAKSQKQITHSGEQIVWGSSDIDFRPSSTDDH